MSFEKLKERFEERYEKIRLIWLGFSVREKIILTALTGVLGLLISVFLIQQGISFIQSSSLFTTISTDQLSAIQKMTSDLERQRGSLMRYESASSRRNEDFDIEAFLKAEGQRLSVGALKVVATRARTEEPNLEWFEIQFSPESRLDALTRYLASVEEILGLKIEELTIKPNFSNPTQLSAQAVVSFKKALE